MSSSLDAGYYAEQLRLKCEELCDKSPTGRHESTWIDPNGPSQGFKCKHCDQLLGYSK